jgi:excisionase family DNA binding protein
MSDKAITAEEAAPILGVHPKTLLKMARRGEVPSLRMGKIVRFTVCSLVQWRDRKIQSACHPVSSLEAIQ